LNTASKFELNAIRTLHAGDPRTQSGKELGNISCEENKEKGP